MPYVGTYNDAILFTRPSYLIQGFLQMKQSKPDLVLTVFKFFASQALAIVLLSVLAVALAAGTIIESLYGATAAQKLIYFNLWFEMLLFILGVNVIFSTLTRLPWKKQHIGFLLTHAGIILILVGSLLTSRFMIDGSVVIEEGKTSDQIILNKPLVLLHHLHEGVGYWVEFRPPALAWNGRRPLKLRPEPKNGLKAALLAYYPHAQAKQGAVVQAGGPAALSVSLQNKFADAGGWLVQDNGPMSAMQLGPAFIHFAKNEVTPESAKSPEKGFLLVTHPQGTQKVPIEKALKEKIKINQTPFELKIVRFFS
ncbi:MAG: cytochrome c biogenesis protein ResB, partial [Candidatus Omnitrophica bacterium]|nr:cytochrome c biogenesis protein ResB [Candidatus Omnitrophota bacterium]